MIGYLIDWFQSVLSASMHEKDTLSSDLHLVDRIDRCAKLAQAFHDLVMTVACRTMQGRVAAVTCG